MTTDKSYEEKLFFQIFDQQEFPTLKGDYEKYLDFKEKTIKIISLALQQERSKALEAITEAFWDGVEQGGAEDAGDCFIAEDYLNNSKE